MKVAVVGSREFKDYDLMCKTLKQLHITEIISGEAIGADTLAKKYAIENNIEYKGFPADWNDMSEPCIKKINRYGNSYNALAGINRNTLIVDYCDVLIAFWNGSSTGTADSINKAKNLNKRVIIINF